MAKKVYTFRSDQTFGSYLSQLEEAAITPDDWFIQGYEHWIVGEDLPEPIANLAQQNRVYTFKSEDALQVFLNAVDLTGFTWAIKNKGAMFTFAALEGGNIYIREVQDVLDRMTGLTDKEIAAIVNFVTAESVELGNGNWGKVDEFYCFSLSGANALTGFKSKTATNNGATLDINGATFNGSDQYINSNYNPTADGVNYQLNDAQAETYIKDYVPADGCAFGIFDQNTENARATLFTEAARLRSGGLNSTGLGDVEPPESNHLYSMVRTSSSERQLLKDGVDLMPGAQGSISVPNLNLAIGARSTVSAPDQFFQGTLSTFMIGGSLPNQSAHYDNLSQLLIDLGVI